MQDLPNKTHLKLSTLLSLRIQVLRVIMHITLYFISMKLTDWFFKSAVLKGTYCFCVSIGIF
jgi:uncharacterized membrane protein YczE